VELAKSVIVHSQFSVGDLAEEKDFGKQKFAKLAPKLKIFARLVFWTCNSVSFGFLRNHRISSFIFLGLPSQLRDAVLSQSEGALAVPESDANREYFVSQQLAQIANGNDPWQTGDTPNDKLLKIVRAVAVEREQNKVKLGAIATLGAGGGKRQNRSGQGLTLLPNLRSCSEIYAKTAGEDSDLITGEGREEGTKTNADDEEEILPPPGMSLEDAKKALNLQVSSTGHFTSRHHCLHLFNRFLNPKGQTDHNSKTTQATWSSSSMGI
jgi:hypothetical protein